MTKDWKIFRTGHEPGNHFARAPKAPPWRRFDGKVDPYYQPAEGGREQERRGKGFQTDRKGRMERMVNAALILRRPLLITGDPGTGKSSLIYAVAWQLQLGEVLRWSITSRSTLAQGLYQYDAIGRLQEAQLREKGDPPPDIGQFIKLGPLGTALLPSDRPRALLIDEIDKSDLDLPNDLLHVFEEGEFVIPELKRMKHEPKEGIVVRDDHGRDVAIHQGRVQCREFPFVVMTSNGEREFPAPFLRRCLRLDMPKPDEKILADIIGARLENKTIIRKAQGLVADFLGRTESKRLATDQLLNAVYLLKGTGEMPADDTKEYGELLDALMRDLSTSAVAEGDGFGEDEIGA